MTSEAPRPAPRRCRPRRPLGPHDDGRRGFSETLRVAEEGEVVVLD
jgi:hypothetical protein